MSFRQSTGHPNMNSSGRAGNQVRPPPAVPRFNAPYGPPVHGSYVPYPVVQQPHNNNYPHPFHNEFPPAASYGPPPHPVGYWPAAPYPYHPQPPQPPYQSTNAMPANNNSSGSLPKGKAETGSNASRPPLKRPCEPSTENNKGEKKQPSQVSNAAPIAPVAPKASTSNATSSSAPTVQSKQHKVAGGTMPNTIASNNLPNKSASSNSTVVVGKKAQVTTIKGSEPVLNKPVSSKVPTSSSNVVIPSDRPKHQSRGCYVRKCPTSAPMRRNQSSRLSVPTVYFSRCSYKSLLNAKWQGTESSKKFAVNTRLFKKHICSRECVRASEEFLFVPTRGSLIITLKFASVF